MKNVTRNAREAELVAAIDGIGARLRGPSVPNIKRIMLNADRHDLRRELNALREKGAQPTT